MKTLIFLLLAISIEAQASFTIWGEETLRFLYEKKRGKRGFPKDLRQNGSAKAHHEAFLWRILDDQELRSAWPIAICLLGDIGNQKTLEKLKKLGIEKFRSWLTERDKTDTALISALVSFSNRGFEEATEILIVGSDPEFWLTHTENAEKVSILTNGCIMALGSLISPKAVVFLAAIRDDPKYKDYRENILETIEEIRHRSRNP